MPFLVPYSYLQSVTLQEQNKASQIFQTPLKIMSGCQSASHMLFFSWWWHLFPGWGNPFNISKGLYSLNFTAQMGSKKDLRKKWLLL